MKYLISLIKAINDLLKSLSCQKYNINKRNYPLNPLPALPFKMPYGYYQAARFTVMLGFALLTYYDYQKNQTINSAVIIYIALALLFQPLIKVALDSTIWNI